jgi:hypothetical protein
VLAGADPASAQDLEAALGEAAGEFAADWQGGNVGRLAELMGEGTIRLHLPDGSHPALSVRLARAALEDLHGGVGVGPVETRQVRLLGGDPARGFAEMIWTPHPSDVSEAVAFTVFAGFEWRDSAWRIVEVRVLPMDERGGTPYGRIAPA